MPLANTKHIIRSDFPVGKFRLPLKTFRLFWNRFKLPGSERCCSNTDSERCGVDFSYNHTFYVFLSWCYDNSLKNNHWWRKSGHHLIIETVEAPECISELYFEPVPNFKNTREVLEKDEVPRVRSDRTPDVLDKIENCSQKILVPVENNNKQTKRRPKNNEIRIYTRVVNYLSSF